LNTPPRASLQISFRTCDPFLAGLVKEVQGRNTIAGNQGSIHTDAPGNAWNVPNPPSKLYTVRNS
jgi:hypothetical protein